MKKQAASDGDLGSFEGKYPGDLFRKAVVVNNQTVGYVAKETDDVIVVFSESDDSIRFDIPKSEITLKGSSVSINEDSLSRYKVNKDVPLPQDKDLRPSAEEIRQIAGEVEEKEEVQSTADLVQRPSMVEEKIKDVASTVKESVGYEIKQASKSFKEKISDLGDDVARDSKYASKRAVEGVKETMHSGVQAAAENVSIAQQRTEANIKAENALKIEKQAQLPATKVDMASYEGKYPDDLLNKTVVSNDKNNNQITIGRIVKEAENTVVVFGSDEKIRFDIPKSEITVVGGSAILNNYENISRYIVKRDVPMPAGKNLRPTAEEIKRSAEELGEQKEQVEGAKRADAMTREMEYLTTRPRPETTGVSRPEGYEEEEEGRITAMIKQAARELKEIIQGGARIAEMKVREGQRIAAEKQAEMDAQKISRMGELSTKFSGSFEDIISEIRTRPYAEQEQIYSGFIKLIDYQRQLLIANKDFAARLKDSIRSSGVTKEEQMAEDKADNTPEHPRTEEADVVNVDVYSDLDAYKDNEKKER